MFSGFDEAFGTFYAEFCNAAVVFGACVIGAGVDFCVWEAVFKFCDFFWSFVDE